MNILAYVLGAIALIILGLSIFYIAGTVHAHNGSIDCLTKVVSQALNEAYHKQAIRPPVCKG